MAIITPEQYYNNEDEHGNYQWTSLKDIIDALELEAQDDDSFLKNTKRYKMIALAKQAIREVTKKAANDLLSIEFTVPDSLVFTLPQDYVNYFMVSVVTVDPTTGTKRLQPLDINSNINISTGFLQDNDANILFDEDGNIITSDGDNAYGLPYAKECFGEGGGNFTLDTSKLSQYGEFTIDERRGKILFSSELSDKEVEFKYVSDGLQAQLTESEITVHKYLKTCLIDWIYYECIATKRNVPQNEKDRARRKMKSSLHQAKMDRSDFNLLQIERTLRTKSMNL
jgi:hypothetical protein